MGMLMYDSTSPWDIPTNAPMVAGYASGRYAWPADGWARFTTPRKIRIVVSADVNDGDVLDVERYDATPAQAPGWVKMRQAAGLWKPTIYCEVSARGAVQDFCKGLRYDLWVAHYTGHQHSEPGAVACQYADPVTSGGHYDLSWVEDSDWPYRTAPGPDPVIEKENEMFVYVPCDDAGNALPGTPALVAQGGSWTMLANEAERDECVAAGAVLEYIKPGALALVKHLNTYRPR